MPPSWINTLLNYSAEQTNCYLTHQEIWEPMSLKGGGKGTEGQEWEGGEGEMAQEEGKKLGVRTCSSPLSFGMCSTEDKLN